MIGLVTAKMAAPLDRDLAPLLGAFGRAGVPAAFVAWDDPDVDWASFDLVILRSTWDYVERHVDFLQWVRRVDALTTMWNPADVVRWNVDKRYLAELARSGVPVVPTTFVEPGEASPAVDPAGVHVVKPTVGAGSRLAARLRGDEVDGHVALVHAEGHTAMVQPYVDLIDTRGETGLVYVGDGDSLEFSHAYSKKAILGSDREIEGTFLAVERIGPRAAGGGERAVGEAVLVSPAIGRLGPLAYARIDLVPTEDGPAVLELELIEPSLHVHVAPGAAEQAAACWARLAVTQ